MKNLHLLLVVLLLSASCRYPQEVRRALRQSGSNRSELETVLDHYRNDVLSLQSAEFLIAHIDRMMDVWQACPWLKDNSFEDFCEYLLPYRFAYEPLIEQADSTDFQWREIIRQTYYYSNLPLTMQDIRHFLHNMINRKDDSYISRTDGNGIVPESVYELLYFDGNWVSAGCQTATADSLVFRQVPSGALYWLRNLTEGREERIFTYDEKYDIIEFL